MEVPKCLEKHAVHILAALIVLVLVLLWMVLALLLGGIKGNGGHQRTVVQPQLGAGASPPLPGVLSEPERMGSEQHQVVVSHDRGDRGQCDRHLREWDQQERGAVRRRPRLWDDAPLHDVDAIPLPRPRHQCLGQ